MLYQFIETIYEEMDYTVESETLKKIKTERESVDKVIEKSVLDDFSLKNL